MLHFFYKLLPAGEGEQPCAMLTCLPEEDAEDYADAIVCELELRPRENGEGCTLVLPEQIDGYPLTALDDFMPEDDGEGGDPSIAGLFLPASLRRIDPGAFEWMDGLESIAVAPENPVFEAVGGVLYNKQEHTLVRCPVRRPERTLIVREGTLRIGANGLAGCTGLVCVLLPEGLEELDTYALRGCTGLEYILLPDSLRHIGMGCFLRCTGLPFIRIPEGVETIGEQAFGHCTNLLEITLPDTPTLTRIGARAFRGCSRLGGISLPGGLTAVAANTFDGCTALARVCWGTAPGDNYPLQTIEQEAFRGCTALVEMLLPEGLRTIGQYAFADCTALAHVHLPASLEEVFPSTRAANGMSFCGCTALGEITLAEGNPRFALHQGVLIGLAKKRILCCPPALGSRSYTVPDWVRSIGTEAFADNPTLAELRLPEGLETVSGSAFARCTALEQAALPPSLRSLGQGAFQGCTALERIALPDGLRTVARSLFAGCTALREVKLPMAAERLESAAFEGCTALLELMLPEGLAELGAKVFRGCAALRRVVLPRSLKQLDLFANVFENCPALTLYVPRGSYAEEALSRFYQHIRKVLY